MPKVQDRVVQQAYMFALSPTARQEEAFRSHAGAARYAYNWGLATMFSALDARAAEKEATGTAASEVPTHFALCKQWTVYKDAHANDPDPPEGERRTNTAWVSENSICVYQAALRDAAAAMKAFFDSKAGRRKGRRVGRPKFKKKGRAGDSFQLHGDTLRIIDAQHINLPKIGRVKVCESMRKVLRRLRKGTVPCPECRACGYEPAPEGSKAKTVRPCPACQPGDDGAWKRENGRAGLTETAGQGTAEAGGGPPGHGMTGVGENQKNGTTESCAGCGGSRNVKPCKACNGSMHVPVLRIVRGTVSRDSAGWWFISLTVNVVRQIRVEPTARQKAGGTIGVDFGVRDLATLSNGDIIRNPRFLAGALRRLARAQRVMARRRNGSPKYALAAARLGRMHARVRHLREDHLQKITTWLVRNHERIGMEGFNVQATAHYGDPDVPRSVRRARNQALADAAIGRGRWMIAHKGGWDGCKVVVTGPHEKTGRTCSRCGQVRITPVPPAKDMFECGNCGFRGSRRVNTAAVAAQYARDGITTTAPSSEDVAKNGRGEDVSRTAVRRRTQSSGKRQASRRPPGGRPGTLGG